MTVQDAANQDGARHGDAELIAGGSTGGRFALVALTVERGAEPPCHRHHNEDEVIYVLAGDVLIQVGEERKAGTPGTAVFIPRGVDHGVAVRTAHARLLTAFLPAGFEEFYREITDVAPGDLDRLIATAARFGCEVTGPPIDAGGRADVPVSTP